MMSCKCISQLNLWHVMSCHVVFCYVAYALVILTYYYVMLWCMMMSCIIMLKSSKLILYYSCHMLWCMMMSYICSSQIILQYTIWCEVISCHVICHRNLRQANLVLFNHLLSNKWAIKFWFDEGFMTLLNHFNNFERIDQVVKQTWVAIVKQSDHLTWVDAWLQSRAVSNLVIKCLCSLSCNA